MKLQIGVELRMSNESLGNIVATVDYYSHRICTPDWDISETITDFVDITYVVSGTAEYMINGQKYNVQAGDLLYIPVGARRSAVVNPTAQPMECYSINGIIRDLDGTDMLIPLPTVSQVGLHREIISLYRDLKFAWLLRNPGYILEARAIYLMILQRFFQIAVFKNNFSTMDTRIKKALSYMTEHYYEPLTIQTLATLVGLSPMYFGNLFKEETEMSFRQYLTAIRINHAEDMLRVGIYTINEIANACGFSDIFYFSKVFKEVRGVAPSKLICPSKKNSRC